MGLHTYLLSALLLSQVTLRLSVASAKPHTVPWSSTYYGPDGPWQAVKVTVGGNDTSLTISAQEHSDVDLLPAGTYGSFVLSDEACVPYGNSNCGAGGRWNPTAETNISWGPGWDDDALGLVGPPQTEYMQAITIFEQTIWNASLVSVTNITIRDPNGKTRGPPLGWLSLGADNKQVQVFTTSPRNASALPYEAFTFSGGLFNQSKVLSYSYGLHIGATAFNFGGSLLFGGYNKGRVIGPYTTFDKNTNLIDIEIGTEVGGSPFDFETKTGLLLSNTSKAESITVIPDPAVPYLHLPSNTCEGLAKLLPITFDNDLKYWLWNVEDPRYRSIVTSAAYLKFVFPPAPGASANVEIKVPFALLNLTLESPISSSPKAYFPCQRFTPNSGDTYRLGRAFLQAAFLGRNWNVPLSWLAQAPGPGASRNGLGDEPVDIKGQDTTISTYNDAALFRKSWEAYWTPLSGGNTTNLTSSATGSPSPGLSTGAKAGIGVGAAAGAIALVAIGAYLLWRRKKQKTMSPETVYHEFAAETKSPDRSIPDYPVPADQSSYANGNIVSPPSPQEMMSQPPEPHELPTENTSRFKQ